MKRSAIAVIGLVFFVSAVSAVQAEMYHWIDENGVKHYSNEAPPVGSGAYRSQKEIKYDAAKDRARTADDDRAVKKFVEKKEREEKVRAEEEKAAEARQKNIEKENLESEKAAVVEEIRKKKRYFNGKSRRHLQALQNINKELADLKQAGGDKGKLEELEAEKKRLVNLLVKDKRYFQGNRALLREYEEIDKALQESGE
jgi:hypothetical protein